MSSNQGPVDSSSSSTLCLLCSSPAKFRCSRCLQVSLCSTEHQRMVSTRYSFPRRSTKELIKMRLFFFWKIWPYHKYQCRVECLNFDHPMLERWETDLFSCLPLSGIHDTGTSDCVLLPFWDNSGERRVLTTFYNFLVFSQP